MDKKIETAYITTIAKTARKTRSIGEDSTTEIIEFPIAGILERRSKVTKKPATGIYINTKNFSAYARKMLIDGYIVHIDTGPVRAQTAELQKIGVNINQIARRINSTGTVYAQDLEDIKGALAQIWQLQRSILSSQR